MISCAFGLLLGGTHRYLDDSNIMFERDRETMFTANSPFSSMLSSVSLVGMLLPTLGPTLMHNVGG
jgi:hypothetical protein